MAGHKSGGLAPESKLLIATLGSGKSGPESSLLNMLNKAGFSFCGGSSQSLRRIRNRWVRRD